MDSDGEQSSHNTLDTNWGSGDGSSSEESSLDEATVHIGNEPNNDIDASADTTTNRTMELLMGKIFHWVENVNMMKEPFVPTLSIPPLMKSSIFQFITTKCFCQFRPARKCFSY